MSYDFEDPLGEADWTKMFVTKLMKTSSGQCHSLPLFYLILAEELGIEAYLGISPNHSYIKLKDDQGIWYNLELTNGRYSTDAWLLASGYIKSEALLHGIYMRPLNDKELIVQCLTDLAHGYLHKFGYDNFVIDCVEKALLHDPKNIVALQIKSNYYTHMFLSVARQMGNPTEEEIKQYPQLHSLFLKCEAIHMYMDKIGFEEMPPEAYKAWLQTLQDYKFQAKFPRT